MYSMGSIAQYVTEIQIDTAALPYSYTRRWAAQIKNVGHVSDHVLPIDVVIYAHTYRIIAIYMPHAGYPSHVSMLALMGSAVRSCMHSQKL